MSRTAVVQQQRGSVLMDFGNDLRNSAERACCGIISKSCEVSCGSMPADDGWVMAWLAANAVALVQSRRGRRWLISS